jgi:hypothetical protein
MANRIYFFLLLYRTKHFFTYNDQSYDKATQEMHNERAYVLYCELYSKSLLVARNSAEMAREVMNISVKSCG